MLQQCLAPVSCVLALGDEVELRADEALREEVSFQARVGVVARAAEDEVCVEAEHPRRSRRRTAVVRLHTADGDDAVRPSLASLREEKLELSNFVSGQVRPA
eukprot:CAMPEP_0170154828 /NCGR_PEP_ID=MMETSP0033_2-20121228/58986_1 /TAXON_ID=195969 /ORGANISM="Dolichomastix tenuilepis, Strain CCMP3274" /LENGTH=101 /DNA_ID=CAMNT_0010392109 /DNA_START=581 /DNA_END=886 /DNA_ORIENTATION=-